MKKKKKLIDTINPNKKKKIKIRKPKITIEIMQEAEIRNEDKGAQVK